MLPTANLYYIPTQLREAKARIEALEKKSTLLEERLKAEQMRLQQITEQNDLSQTLKGIRAEEEVRPPIEYTARVFSLFFW